VLASQSPRRAALLTAAGFSFTQVPADVDETLLPGERPEAHVKRLARAKAQVIAGLHPDAIILGADTVVVLGPDILGKPTDAADASRMLRLLAGRTHQVYTGVALWHGGQLRDAVEISAVEFTTLSTEEIDWYVASGEPMDKAGAYAVQGLASRFVARIDGSYSGVVGLPVAVVHRLLRDLVDERSPGQAPRAPEDGRG